MFITQAPHPLLRTLAFETILPQPLGQFPSPPWLQELLKLHPESDPRLAQLPPREEIFKAYRQLLRWGSFKASGRSKPAAEYLDRTARTGQLPTINAAVDVLNAVSLHTGVPIGVIDLDLAQPPLHIDLGQAGEEYIFNRSGQEMHLEGLICLRDAQGPCANPVKDSQRTKTNENTKRTLTLVWSSLDCSAPAQLAYQWQQELLRQLGAEVREVEVKCL